MMGSTDAAAASWVEHDRQLAWPLLTGAGPRWFNKTLNLDTALCPLSCQGRWHGSASGLALLGDVGLCVPSSLRKKEWEGTARHVP